MHDLQHLAHRLVYVSQLHSKYIHMEYMGCEVHEVYTHTYIKQACTSVTKRLAAVINNMQQSLRITVLGRNVQGIAVLSCWTLFKTVWCNGCLSTMLTGMYSMQVASW